MISLLRSREAQTRALFHITAITGFVAALSYMLLPRQVLWLWDITPTDEWGILALRFYGSLALFWALVSWFARGTSDCEARQAIVRALFVGFVTTTAMPVLAMVSGVGRRAFAVVAVAHALLAAAWGVIYFSNQRGSGEAVPREPAEPGGG
jgi:hypothetical protein